MSLIHETTTKGVGGYQAGDIKIVPYSISFTLHQLVTPAQDPGWFLLNGATFNATIYPILAARFGGSTLPDFTDGVIPIPKGLTNFTSFGAVGGEINHTLLTAEMASHSHGDTFSVGVSGHGHSGAASCGGPDESHNHLYTYLAAGSVGGSSGGALDTADTGITGDTAGGGGHQHGYSVNVGNTASSNLSVSGSISSIGGGGSHNNMQPYLVLGGWLVKFG